MSKTLGLPDIAAAKSSPTVNAFAAAFRNALSKRRCPRTVQGLSYLSDTVLKDIGLSRAELFSVAGVPIDDVVAGRRGQLPGAFVATPSRSFSKGANDNARR
jgi:uncharacterized protein YjiS (DUF1127 family)